MKTIEHLEELSMLKFSEEEKRKFKNEFDPILEFVSQIENISLDEMTENCDGLMVSEFREDKVQKSMKKEDALMNAPIVKDGCYSTPLVIE